MADPTNSVITLLRADSTLDTLLGATASDPKLYPLQAPQEKAEPFIVYTLYAAGTPEPIMYEFSMLFNIYANTYIAIQNIATRLEQLLDLQDEIVISDANYDFLHSKLISKNDLNDPDTEEIYRVMTFHFKIHKLN